MSNRVVLFLFYKYIINIISRIKKKTNVLHLHKHGSEFNEVAVIWIFHLHHSPRIHSTSDLFALDLYHSISTNHCKRHCLLQKSFKYSYSKLFNSSHNTANSSINWGHCHTLLRTIKRPWQLNWPWGGDIALCNPRPHPRHSRAARTGWCRSQLSGSSPAQVTKVHDQWLITCVVLIKHFTYMNVFHLKLTYISYYFIVIWLWASQDCNAVTFQGL